MNHIIETIMTLKEKIQEDFIQSMKQRNEVAKLALNGLKASITEAEKAGANVTLEDADVLKILIKSIRTREDSAKIYREAKREDLAEKEMAEAEVLRVYMPAAMSETEIKEKALVIFEKIGNALPDQARKGKTMGEFNKLYAGLADAATIKKVIFSL